MIGEGSSRLKWTFLAIYLFVWIALHFIDDRGSKCTEVTQCACPPFPLLTQMDEAARRVGKAATSLDFGGERFGKIQVCRRDAGARPWGHTESPSTDDVRRPPRMPQDLQSTVRLKAHPQRSLGTFRLRIADDLVIAVAMYAALQPATKQKVRVGA